ncbi:MAG: type II toxin-antitoxin system VapC family toxin [Casimicrobiaceae bacterium]
MILIDANLLIYAYHADAPEHVASKRWLEDALSGSEFVRFAWLTLWAFLRIATHARVFEHPLSLVDAQGAISLWLAQPNSDIAEPGERHWAILRDLTSRGQATGPLTMDAALAAIAMEHGATLCTTDRDFARFPGLKWRNPLEAEA